jgi:hypothetical protein
MGPLSCSTPIVTASCLAVLAEYSAGRLGRWHWEDGMFAPRLGWPHRLVLPTSASLLLVVATFHLPIDAPSVTKAYAKDGKGDSHGGKGKGNAATGEQTGVEHHVNAATGDKVEVDGDTITVIHTNGMKEKIDNGRFRMEDALGRTIVERAATAADLKRLKGL